MDSSITLIYCASHIRTRSSSSPVVLPIIFWLLCHLEFIDLSNVAVHIDQINLISLASFRSCAASDFIWRLLLISDDLLGCLWIDSSRERSRVMDHSRDRLLACVASEIVREKHVDLLGRDQWALWRGLILRVIEVIRWLSRVKTLIIIIFLRIHWIVSFSYNSWWGIRLVSPARDRLNFRGC